MKICIDCRMWGRQYAGIGRYTQEIVSYLLLNKKWNFVLLTSECSHNALCSFIRENNLMNVELSKCNSNLFSIRAQIELLIRIPTCDILWVPSINVPILPVKAKKIVTTIHDVFHLAHPEYYKKWEHFILKKLISVAAKRSSIIFTVSDFSANEIVRFYGKNIIEKIHRVYNGFNNIQFVKNYPFKERFNYLLFVGSVKPHKNLKNALLAYEKSMRTGKNLRFVIVGKRKGFVTSDHDIETIVNRININYENVIFTGNVDDNTLYSIYASASAFIMPSFYEGFGIPLVEAMYFHLPIICSDISVFHEICGNQVLYFDPCNVESICKRIEEVRDMTHRQYIPWKEWNSAGESIASIIEDNM